MAKQIQQRQSTGQDAGPLWSAFENETHLTYGQCVSVFQVASNFEAIDTAKLGEQRTIAAEWHAAQRAHRALGTPAPASAVPQIHELQVERDNNVLRARARLQALLGDNGFEVLEIYVHDIIGRQVKVFSLTVPQAPNGGQQ